MVTERDLEKLHSACAKLPKSSVIEEEAHVFESPLLISMSTVLSLNRRWYSHALPARKRFEQGSYGQLSKKTLGDFQTLVREVAGDNDDWQKLSEMLWKNKEKQKAKQLAQLVDYFCAWCAKFHPEIEELAALKKWAVTISKERFLGKIKGLGPRAYEQLLWYLEGTNAIKLDRHVVKFIHGILGSTVSETEGVAALRKVAAQIGSSATALDARIWDYMQSGAKT